MILPPSPKARILVIEDDPGTALLERAVLRRAGYEVETASDTRQAQAILAAKLPDLLLLDYWLAGGENGLEWYLQMRQQGLRIPAILVTGLSDEECLECARRDGICDCIPKSPELVDRVAPTVNRVLARLQGERSSEISA